MNINELLAGGAIGLITGLITGLIFHFLQSRETKKSNTELTSQLLILKQQHENDLEKIRKESEKEYTFFQSKNGQFSEEFYKHINGLISESKQSIYITGRGITSLRDESDLDFNPNDKNYRNAKKYITSFEEALSKPSFVKVLRVQFGNDSSHAWLRNWYRLWQEYSPKLQFYILDDEKTLITEDDDSPFLQEKVIPKEIIWHDMVHVAAIDYETNNAIAEFMLPMDIEETEGKTQGAGSALFANNHPNSAQQIRNKIVTLSKSCIYVNSEEKWLFLIKRAEEIKST